MTSQPRCGCRRSRLIRWVASRCRSSFRLPGPHDLSLQLPDDELPGDNQRWAAVPVKDSLLIRLVDGEPSSEPFGSEVDYLAAPLSVGIGAAEAWRVEVVQEQDFLSPRLDPADVLVLANVAAPTPEQADRLRSLVRAGMGLMIFTGAKVDVGLYNDLLFKENDKVLPYKLKTLVDETIHGLFVEPLRPSPLEKLLELKPSALERVVARQIMTVEEPGDPDQVRVLARWNNPSRSPAVIERIVGEGRVLLWTTTADRAGNDWPIEPSFVLAVREAVRGHGAPDLIQQYGHGRRRDEARDSLQPTGNQRQVDGSRGRRTSVDDGHPSEGPRERSRAGGRDHDQRHASRGLVPPHLGRGSPGNPARFVRGQPRPARKCTGADRGVGTENLVRAAHCRDRFDAKRRS